MNLPTDYVSPRAGPTPEEDSRANGEPFYFEVAAQIHADKDRCITLLQVELQEYKNFVSEQLQRKNIRSRVVEQLTSVVNDIVALYPKFLIYPAHPDNDRRNMLANIKGIESVINIVDYIDKFKNNSIMLRMMQSELLQVTFENASYDSSAMNSGKKIVGCHTKSSIIRPQPFHAGDGIDYLFSYLLNQMEDIIIGTLRLIFHSRGSPNSLSCWDGIQYQSKEEHTKLWGYKKTFAKQMVDYILVYIADLIILL
jgi:hypothetical protein